MNTPTPHIKAAPGDFAPTVLMPGDPLRSQYIAEKFLTEAKLVNNVRGVQGYTGNYRGTKVSVMASGMGMPSMGIYSHELFNFYDVRNIIRVGSTGALQPEVGLRHLVIAQGASCDSGWDSQFHLPGTCAALASWPLLETCVGVAKGRTTPYHVGNILSSQFFYYDDADLSEAFQTHALWAKMGVLAVEMETAALYLNAARFGRRALTVCTVSDQLLTKQHLSTEERQQGFDEMVTLALDTAVALDHNGL